MAKRLEVLSPNSGLSFLLRMDTYLYSLQSTNAVRYGNSKHPKHRLTSYHDFFIERIKASDKVLDFGTGKGAVAYDIATSTGAHVDGIDISKENIDLARKYRSHQLVRFFCCVGRYYSFDQNYDVVILSNVLEHIIERTKLLQDLTTATKAKRFLIRVPVFQRDWRVALKRELDIEWRLDLDHKTEFSIEDFAIEMQIAGLAIEHIEVKWGEIWAELIVSRTR